MSAGRRNWRPEAKRKGRDDRRLKIILLSSLLAVLVGILLLPWLLSPESDLRFVSLGTDEPPTAPVGLTSAPDSLASVSRRKLDSLFRKLHVLNPSLVLEPQTVLDLSELQQAVEPDEKLMVYCGLPCRPVLNSETETSAAGSDAGPMLDVVFVQSGSTGTQIRLSKLLETLEAVKADQIVLLLDLTEHTAGLANGVLNDDVVSIAQTVVQQARIPRLSLICAHTAGQRSWEFLPPAEETDTSTATPAPSTAATSATDSQPVVAQSLSGLYSGTAFSHFVGQAFAENQTETAEQLSQFLQDKVSAWVKQTYGETQTVTLHSAGTADKELLRRGGWSQDDVAQARDPNDPEPPADDQSDDDADDQSSVAATDSKTGDGGSEDSDGTSQAADADTPAVLLSRLEVACREVPPICQAIAPKKWLDLNTLQVAAKVALLHGDDLTFGKMHDQAWAKRDELELELRKAMAQESDRDFAPWFASGSTDTDITSEQQAAARNLFDEALEDLGAADSQARVPRQLRERGIDRQLFADALLQDLQQQARVAQSNPESQGDLIQPRVRLIQRLSEASRAGWPKNDWPQQLFTIEEVLAGPSSEAQVQPLNLLVRLLELRRQVLTAAAGFTADGHRLRREVWQPQFDSLRQLLIKLTAAERWLALGPLGEEMGGNTLNAARAEFADLEQQLNAHQQLAAIRDDQRTDLAFLIQFLAQQHEQVPLTTRELEAAKLLGDPANSIQRLPDGLLDQLDMTAAHIQAMFALTRDLQAEPVEPRDVDAYRLLQTYLQNRRSQRDSFAEERQRLLWMPDTVLAGSEFSTQLGQSGRPAVTGENRTGIWVAFWSIRMLQAVNSAQYPELWSQWTQLVEQLLNKAPESLETRTRLAQELQTRWQKFYATDRRSEGASVFVTREDASRLFAADLEQRYQAGGRNQALYADIHRSLFELTPRSRPVEFTITPDKLALDTANRAAVEVRSTGGAALFVWKGGIGLEQTEFKVREDWMRVAQPGGPRTLNLHATNGLQDPVPMTLALASVDDVVLASKQILVHPSGKTHWQIDFLYNNQPLVLPDRQELPLPSTTLDAEGKDAPIPLTVRFTQTEGTAKKVSIQAYTSDPPKKLWPDPQMLDVVDGQVVLPLQPAAAADAAAASAGRATVSSVDLSKGLSFVLIPQGFDAEQQTISIRPVLRKPAHYLHDPEVEFDPNKRELTIQVRPRTDRNDPLWPEKLPVAVHFSPALSRLRQGQAADKAPALPNNGQTFRFVFGEDLIPAFRDDAPFEDNSRNLEFSISVAGIQHAFSWQLLEDRVQPLLSDEPKVRAELSLNSVNKATPVQREPFLMFAATAAPGIPYVEPTFDVSMYVHRNGQFSREKAEWELQLQLQNTNSEQATQVLREPVPLVGAWREVLTAAPSAEGAAWNFSTTTLPYQRTNLQLDRDHGLKPGKYDLVASLRRIGESGANVSEHRVQFVIDETPPAVRVNIDPNREYPTNRPLTGAIIATDEESDVVNKQVELEGAKPVKVRADGSFTIPVVELPQLKPGPGEIPRTSRTLTVTATNRVGLTSPPVQQTITFFARGAAMQSTPQPPGKVVFESKAPQKFTVTLKDANGKLTLKEGTEMIEFADLQPGRYLMFWVGPNQGQKNIVVKSGETVTVSK